MSDPVEAVVDRLLAVDWDGEYGQRRSQVALMREYLRRSALWSKHLDAGPWPFFDIAAAVDPDVRADQAAVDRLEEGLPDWLYPRCATRACGRCTSRSCGGPGRNCPICRIRSSRCC